MAGGSARVVGFACMAALASGACRCDDAPRARSRGVVDFHTHIGLGMVSFAEASFARNDVAVAVNLSGRPVSRGLMQRIAEADTRPQGAAAQIVVFSGVPWRFIDEPDFGELAAEDLRHSVALGARGLKISKVLGLVARTADGRLLPVDSPRLDPLWAAAAELRVPVAIHTGDPLAFFEPVNDDNERIEELRAHPSWSFVGGDYPSLHELLFARDRLSARHPRTTFVAVHVGGLAEDLAAVAQSMRANANLWIDVAARIPELGRHDASAAASFFEEFQDRIVFGTDLQLHERRIVLGSSGEDDAPTADDVAAYYDVHWRYFETSDRDFRHMTPIQGRWLISGIGLREAVLDKIYRRNALRLLGMTRDER